MSDPKSQANIDHTMWTIADERFEQWRALGKTMFEMADHHQLEGLSIEMVRKGPKTQWRALTMWQDGKGKASYGDTPIEAVLGAIIHPDHKPPPHLYLIEEQQP